MCLLSFKAAELLIHLYNRHTSSPPQGRDFSWKRAGRVAAWNSYWFNTGLHGLFQTGIWEYNMEAPKMADSTRIGIGWRARSKMEHWGWGGLHGTGGLRFQMTSFSKDHAMWPWLEETGIGSMWLADGFRFFRNCDSFSTVNVPTVPFHS